MSDIPLRNGEYTVKAYDVNMSSSTLEDCLVAGAAIKYVSFEKSALEMVRFDQCTFFNASFEGATLERVSFVNARIKNGRYAGMTIEGIPVEDLLQTYRSAREPSVVS